MPTQGGNKIINNMIKPAAGKWPRVQLVIHCQTCNWHTRFSIYYGESTIWGNQNASHFAEWASHEDHDVQVSYEFTHGRKMTATGVKV